MSNYPTLPTDYSWLSIGSKDCSSNRFQIPTNSIMKFRFECEEFPLSPTKFGSNFQPIQGWESWVNKIHLRMKRLFFMVGVYDVVQVTFKLLTHREKRIEAWYSILSRWSTVSHTIITTWGGFIFTLEDVNVLLELPCFQKYNICSLELSKKEKKIKELFSNLFKSEYERSKVTQFSNWIGMFHQKFNSIKGENSSPEFLEHKYESEASLVIWLARHIFSEHLDHGISLVIVHAAIKISYGMHFPLTLLYLGNLYKQLDLYHIKIEIFGRFSACAPPPNPSPSPATSSNKFVGNNYKVWLWHNQNSKGNILQVLDIIKEFTWCQYIQEKNGFGNPEYFYAILE
ncbi:hypothetical protein Godav_023577 [Gossypium davidsonii]|uniref:Aminotransferase-like plant mobile domain-containing protein n=2 Tax=Gossypium TaxID=3633 RepID=A0A7J8SS49_GOSDV|nr:hypothetical protein [Gossypium davidsonii]MBA0664632.1 hypothetical protein [Gossypium klotzschianum]